MTTPPARDPETIFSLFQGRAELLPFLEDFVQTAPERRARLSDDFQSGRLDDVLQTAHLLKGSGSGYGFQGLSELAASLETACQAEIPDPAEIGRRLDKVLTYLSRVGV